MYEGPPSDWSAFSRILALVSLRADGFLPDAFLHKIFEVSAFTVGKLNDKSFLHGSILGNEHGFQSIPRSITLVNSMRTDH